MLSRSFSIPRFLADAKEILKSNLPLESQQEAIGEDLSELSWRDDLTRPGMPVGPLDAHNQNYALWREPPHTALVLGQFDDGYLSPVHENAEFWVVRCGYRGEDRWDMYERVDAGNQPGYAEVKPVDQWSLPPGKFVAMPKPPQSIHSHNNAAKAATMELIFSAGKPLPRERRVTYDVEGKTCWQSAFNLGGILVGDFYPPRQAEAGSSFQSALKKCLNLLSQWGASRMSCPTRLAWL